MKKEEKTKLKMAVGYASRSAQCRSFSQHVEKADTCLEQESTANGDIVFSCWLPDGSQAVILSDGMGHGAAAAEESRLAARRLRQLLKQGVPVARGIREVNRLLMDRAGDREMFATVDLMVLDRGAGRARFYKLGAAPSYIIRGRRIRTVQQAALPVGILPQLKLTHVSARLSAGDIIVMMSDGIADSGAEDWVKSFLDDLLIKKEKDGTVRQPGPRQLAGMLLSEAEKRCSGGEMDDATAAVIILR